MDLAGELFFLNALALNSNVTAPRHSYDLCIELGNEEQEEKKMFPGNRIIRPAGTSLIVCF